MSEIEVAELIETHIDYYVVDLNGNRYSVHLGKEFVKHAMRRHDSVLPKRMAFVTMPMVMADGTLLAPKGLDRERKIQFLIPDELRAIIPRREDCTPEAVKAAMEYLCNVWLVDVATDPVGKAVCIALALNLIERMLLDNRPVFNITAGRRGNGKTTAIIMMIKGVLAETPSAMAWSFNAEERRKSLMSSLLSGRPYILWDNIPRGTPIACQYLEMACTIATYSDRILGVSKHGNAAATVIMIFTGNNLRLKGDLASRGLTIRLGVDRIDPENRKFKHTDPVRWTESNRGKILGALYTILLGNPQLKEKHDAPGKTRFKTWWRLVGSAVEHAMTCTGQQLDFQSLFLEQEQAGDEDTASLADMLDILERRYKDQEIKAAEVAGSVNNPITDGDRMIREFLLPGLDVHFKFSSATISNALRKHVDEPAAAGERKLVLRARRDSHSKAWLFHVVDISEAAVLRCRGGCGDPPSRRQPQK